MVRKVAVVEADTEFRTALLRVLSREGYRTLSYRSSDGTWASIRQEQPDCVIMDPWLGHVEPGWRLITQLRDDPVTARIPIILCPTNPRLCLGRGSILVGQRDRILEKPVDLEALLLAVRCAVSGRERVNTISPRGQRDAFAVV